MKDLLSVDPGVRACGCALWKNGVLVSAELVLGVPRGVKASPAELIKHMVSQVKHWCSRSIDNPSTGIELVIEMMRTYGGRAQRGDTNDLIMVSLVSGGIILDYPSRLVLPQEWKGGVPKKNAHGDNVIKERCLKKLSATEIATIKTPSKSLEHNVYDAIGIGLWHLNRTT